jgi:hypothetical protein
MAQSISVVKNFRPSVEEIQIQDTRDYAGGGITAASSIFKLTDPFGVVFYENSGFATDNFASPDLDYSGAPYTDTFSQALPKFNGEPIRGTYLVEMKTQSSTGGPSTVETFSPKKYSSGIFQNPEPNVTVTIDCFVPSIVVRDTGVYGPGSLARSWSVAYPASLGLTPLSASTDPTYTITNPTPIYTGDWGATHTVVETITVARLMIGNPADTEEYTLIQEGSDTEYFKVNCVDLCVAHTCMKTLWDQYEAVKTSDINLANNLYAKWNEASNLLALLLSAQKCGSSNFNDIYCDFQKVIGETVDCGCASTDSTITEPALVTGNCSTTLEDVIQAGTGISVASTTSGGQKVWTINSTQINSTSVAVGTDTPDELTVTNNSVGQAWDFTIDHDPPQAWVEFENADYNDSEYVKITSEGTGWTGDAVALAYREERRYERSDGRNGAIVRMRGYVRVNLTSGSIAAGDLVDLPAIGRVRPETPTELQGRLIGITSPENPVYISIDTDGDILVNCSANLASFSPYTDGSGSYFLLWVNDTYEGLEPIP